MGCHVAAAGLFVEAGVSGVACVRASHVVEADGRTVGAVYGPVRLDEASLLVRRLAVCDDPDTSARDLPWAAVALRRGGSVAVTCSTMLVPGLFWWIGDDGCRLIVATDPGSVIRGKRCPTALDDDYLRGLVLMRSDPVRTPFVGIHRMAAGDTLVWTPGSRGVETVQWCGPDTLPPPAREGDGVLGEYLATFDAVTANLVERAGPVVATVSGGLDSTFMAASLARAVAGGQVVNGYCHSPLPEANAQPYGKFDPDDFPLARLMADRYPGVVHVMPLRNDEHVHPLDAAATAYRSSWWPTLSPGNAVWLGDFAARAGQIGARLRFHGGQGNATYSYEHHYAAGYYLRSLRPWRAVSLASPGMGHGLPVTEAVRNRVVGPLRRPGRPGMVTVAAEVGIQTAALSRRLEPQTRAGFLLWATGRRGGFPAAMNPAGGGTALAVDPYAARSIIELAASVEPRQWQRGPGTRAMARRLAQGRVPDEIRLRSRRGGQGLDAWFVVRNDPDRFEAGLARVAASPVFADYVDHEMLRRWWNQASDSGTCRPPVLNIALRLLATAEFEREIRSMLMVAS